MPKRNVGARTSVISNSAYSLIIGWLVVLSLGLGLGLGLYATQKVNPSLHSLDTTSMMNKVLIMELMTNVTVQQVEVLQSGTVDLSAFAFTTATTYAMKQVTMGELSFVYLEIQPALVSAPDGFNAPNFQLDNWNPVITPYASSSFYLAVPFLTPQLAKFEIVGCTVVSNSGFWLLETDGTLNLFGFGACNPQDATPRSFAIVEPLKLYLPQI